MSKIPGFKFAIKGAKPFLKKHYGHARAGVSAEFTARKKGKGFEYNLHATVPADSVHKAKKHLKKNKLLYEIGASAGAGYLGANYAHNKKRGGK